MLAALSGAAFPSAAQAVTVSSGPCGAPFLDVHGMSSSRVSCNVRPAAKRQNAASFMQPPIPSCSTLRLYWGYAGITNGKQDGNYYIIGAIYACRILLDGHARHFAQRMLAVKPASFHGRTFARANLFFGKNRLA